VQRQRELIQLTHDQYEILEQAVARGTRIAVQRRNAGRREYIIVPLKLHSRDGREAIEARNPNTGHDLTIYVDEIERVEAVR
jgi:hypothetical protein